MSFAAICAGGIFLPIRLPYKDLPGLTDHLVDVLEGIKQILGTA